MATENLLERRALWSDTSRPLPVERDSYETGPDDDPAEQWFFQYHENLLLTVQAVYRLHQALLGKML